MNLKLRVVNVVVRRVYAKKVHLWCPDMVYGFLLRHALRINNENSELFKIIHPIRNANIFIVYKF